MTLACHGVVTVGMEKSSRILSTCLAIYLPVSLCIYGTIHPSIHHHHPLFHVAQNAFAQFFRASVSSTTIF